MRLPAILSILTASILLADEVKLGKPLTLRESTPLEELSTRPERYIGKTVQVKGRITEVCEMMGCWMNLVDPVDPGNSRPIRVKVNDGDIVFPKSSVGKLAIAEGKWVKLQLTREQAVARVRHEAEEQGKPFKPESVRSGVVIYQIQGSGAIVQEPSVKALR